MERIKVWIKLTHTQRLSSLSLSVSLCLPFSDIHTPPSFSPSLSLFCSPFLFLSLSHTQSYTLWTEQIMLLEVFCLDPWKQSIFVWIKISLHLTHSLLSLALPVSHSPWNELIFVIKISHSHSHTPLCLSVSISLSLYFCLPISLLPTHTLAHSYIRWTEQIMLLEVYCYDPWKESRLVWIKISLTLTHTHTLSSLLYFSPSLSVSRERSPLSLTLSHTPIHARAHTHTAIHSEMNKLYSKNFSDKIHGKNQGLFE